jgi:hypothetical protein
MSFEAENRIIKQGNNHEISDPTAIRNMGICL